MASFIPRGQQDDRYGDMTIFAGETLVVTHTATSNGVALSDDDVESVVIEIFDSDWEVVVDNTEMTWDDVQERWEYVWYTVTDDATPAPLSAGTYHARVTLNGLADTTNHEYKRIRLKDNPVALG